MVNARRDALADPLMESSPIETGRQFFSGQTLASGAAFPGIQVLH
jgi:hypothetical protein